MNITLYHDIDSVWKANQTVGISGVSNSTTFTINDIPNGTIFDWNCFAHDNMSRGNFAPANWTIEINIPPNQPPTTPTIILCDGTDCVNNGTFYDNININCSGSSDSDDDVITYSIQSYYNSTEPGEDR